MEDVAAILADMQRVVDSLTLMIRIQRRKISKLRRRACRRQGFWERDVPRNSPEFFKECFRVDRVTFNKLVELLPGLNRSRSYRQMLSVEKSVAVALYTLGCVTELRVVGKLFGIPTSMVSSILLDFCKEVINQMAEKYLPAKFITQSKIEMTVRGFEALGFPQCFGVIDSCHIEIKPCAETAKEYYNSKEWYSIVLLVLVDHRGKFVYTNVGAPGCCRDNDIFEQSDLKRMTEETPLFAHNAKIVGGKEVPVVMLSDDALPFSQTVMKPYKLVTSPTEDQRAFNCRLSAAKRVVDNAFLQLRARFRRITKELDTSMEDIKNIINCCCILHNFFSQHNCLFDDKWLIAIDHEEEQPEHRSFLGDDDMAAETIRRAFVTHFASQPATS